MKEERKKSRLKRFNNWMDKKMTDEALKIAGLIIFLLAALVMLGSLFIFGLRSG